MCQVIDFPAAAAVAAARQWAREYPLDSREQALDRVRELMAEATPAPALDARLERIERQLAALLARA